MYFWKQLVHISVYSDSNPLHLLTTGHNWTQLGGLGLQGRSHESPGWFCLTFAADAVDLRAVVEKHLPTGVTGFRGVSNPASGQPFLAEQDGKFCIVSDIY